MRAIIRTGCGRRRGRTERRLAVFCARIDISATADEHTRDLDVALAACVVQRGPPKRIAVIEGSYSDVRVRWRLGNARDDIA